jgi:hypothetical protein
MLTNKERLRKIMKEKKLTYQKVSIMLNVSLQTVRSWMGTNQWKSHRNMPDRMINYLEEITKDK